MINTSCQHCIFKKLDCLMQVGCQLGRIEKFREQGVKVEYCEEGYLTVFDRICTALRTKAWAKKQDNPVDAVFKEIATPVDMIIMATRLHIDIRCLQDTIECINNQVMLPKTLRVVINTDTINSKDIVKFIDRQDPPFEFFVDDIKLRTEDGQRISEFKAIDIAADKCESTYYAVFHAGAEVPPAFIFDIDFAINKQLERFCLLEPNEKGNGLVVQQHLHKLLMGNREIILKEYEDGALISDNIVDKTNYFAKMNNQTYMIKKVKEICKGM